MEFASEIDEIKAKSTSSILFLTLRNLGIQAAAFIGFFTLTILLGTGDVGLFAIVSQSIAILSYFSDIGLASALIQQKDEVTLSELRTSFTIQTILVVIGITVIAILYPQIATSRHFGSKEEWIVIALCYSFFLSSLKTIPSVLLERKLDFKTISTVDIVENISFYFFAVVFALLGFGAYSYAIAIFIRSTLGLTLMYLRRPWSIGIDFSIPSIKRLFKFGIPYQFNSFVALAKDNLSSLLVAGIIGRNNYAYLDWAQKGTRMPLSLMDSIMRVTFPTFSRIQENKDLLKRSLERSLFFIAFFVFPSVAGIALLVHDFIYIVPKYTKWAPAILPAYFYAVSFIISSITTPLTNAFNAVGKITFTTKMMVVWTVLTWIFYPFLSIHYGFVGTAIAALIVTSSSIIVWLAAGRQFGINILTIVFHPLISTLIMISLILLFNYTLAPVLPLFLTIIIKIVIGIVTYSAYHFFFSRQQITWFASQLKWLKLK